MNQIMRYGPNGMSSYIWLDSLDNQIGSEQCITINTLEHTP